MPEDLFGMVNDPEAGALFHWLRAVTGSNQWWVCL